MSLIYDSITQDRKGELCGHGRGEALLGLEPSGSLSPAEKQEFQHCFYLLKVAAIETTFLSQRDVSDEKAKTAVSLPVYQGLRKHDENLSFPQL